MSTTISKLFPTGVLQSAVDLDETVLQSPSGSARFTGSSSTRLSVTSNTAFTLGANNHTIEFWMYQTSRNLYDTAWTYGNNYAVFAANAYYFNTGTNQFQVILGDGSAYATTTNLATNPPSLNVWHHYAIVRNSANLTLYVDGTSQGSINVSTRSITTQPGAMLIGSSGTAPGSITGYISNFRFVNGSALYTSNFTPPTVPLTAVANTKLLLSQDNSSRLLTDSSSNQFTVSNINGVAYNSLTPFYFPMMRVSTTGICAVQFDEVNLDAGVAERRKSDGTYQVSGYFDEYTLTLATPIVTSGLQFNLATAPSTGSIWTDSSGNGYNATLQGSPSYVSNNGGGIRLNNEDTNGTDYISVPYNIASNTVTVEVVASFNPTSFWGTIWGNEIYNDSGGYLAYVDGSTTLYYGIPNNETSVTITDSNAIRQWIFVINGTQASLFLNGSQIGTTATISNQTIFATGDFYFGARHLNNGTGFGGDTMNNSNSALYPVFYQMRVYNKALSGAEITQNYDAIKSTYGI